CSLHIACLQQQRVAILGRRGGRPLPYPLPFWPPSRLSCCDPRPSRRTAAATARNALQHRIETLRSSAVAEDGRCPPAKDALCSAARPLRSSVVAEDGRCGSAHRRDEGVHFVAILGRRGGRPLRGGRTRSG